VYRRPHRDRGPERRELHLDCARALCADVALFEAIAYDGEGHAAADRSGAPRESRARASVHDLLGRTTDVLVDGVLPPGRTSVVWDCGAARGGVSSGVSFVKMEAPGKEITKKVVLVR
jgi:hypothetical protein